MKYSRSDLCQLGWMSCMGCCGRDVKDKLSVAKGIEKNTIEYMKHAEESKPAHEFMNRSQSLRDSGICRNLVYDVQKDRIFCPLHPDLNSGVDIRINHEHCDVMHICKTSYLYSLWDDKRKSEFLRFLHKKKRQGMDWYMYSKKMTNDELILEFEGMDW
jgi:hypothetical protein